ncbi:unnamed protein product [Camellia sinensis]
MNVDQNGKQLILPSGYMFSPLDSELVVHYLKKKILNQELPPHIIATIGVYSYDSPNQLPLSEFKYGLPNEWYFFTTRSPHNFFLTGNGGGWNELADETVVDNDQVVCYEEKDPSMASSDSSTDLDQGKDKEVENIESSIHTKQ